MPAKVECKDVEAGHELGKKNGEGRPVTRQAMKQDEWRAVMRTFDVVNGSVTRVKLFAGESGGGAGFRH
jgi:hypothetical protein